VFVSQGSDLRDAIWFTETSWHGPKMSMQDGLTVTQMYVPTVISVIAIGFTVLVNKIKKCSSGGCVLPGASTQPPKLHELYQRRYTARTPDDGQKDCPKHVEL
jgi:hypothetical protein